MTPLRWLVLGFLVAGLVVVQRCGLDAQPETVEELKPFREVAHMKASEVLPAYIASLSLGAMRAIWVDILWIQLKAVEDERRWYEQRNILHLISMVQPRNPEVWAHLGWHSAYNVANGFNDEKSRQWTEDSRAWEWVEFGLTWLRKGTTNVPDSAYLKYEIARTLAHKPTWRDSRLELALLKRIEEDRELQALLQDREKIERPMSAFELAVFWLERAKADLDRTSEGHQLTQVGLYIYPMTLDGAMRECLYFQGIYDWQSGRLDEAKAAFRRTAEHTAGMLKRYEGTISPLYKDWLAFYSGLPEAVDLDDRARKSGLHADERAAFLKLLELVSMGGGAGSLDDHFLWHPGNPESPINRLKRKAARTSRGVDPTECNDSFKLATYIRAGDLPEADLEPPGEDVDYFMLQVMPPGDDGHGHAPQDGQAHRPIKVRLGFSRPATAGMDLNVTVYDSLQREVTRAEVRGRREIPFEAQEPGFYYVKVAPLGPLSPWPKDTTYYFSWRLEE